MCCGVTESSFDILPKNLGVVPMTEECLFIRKDFVSKFKKLTRFPLHRSTKFFFLGS